MSKKIVTFKEESQPRQSIQHFLPASFKLKNITNQQNDSHELNSLKLRIEELQNKVSQLQARIRIKRKRIRRKSCEVQKRYKCETCKKLYGSLVSLNLHLRIKHKRDRSQGPQTPSPSRNQSEQLC